MVVTKHGFHISKGNMKLGNIHNFSTTPIVTCAKGVPCSKDCYAMKAYRCYPSAKEAWDANTMLLVKGKYKEFVEDLVEHISNKGNPLGYFRFSVAGDIFSTEYLEAIFKICRECPDTKFWTYTKQFDIISGHVDDIPDNLSVILSTWKDYEPPKELATKLPGALYDDGDVVIPWNGFQCPSDCSECKFCATMTEGDIVVFHKH